MEAKRYGQGSSKALIDVPIRAVGEVFCRHPKLLQNNAAGWHHII